MALWKIAIAIVMLIAIAAVTVRLLSPRAKPKYQITSERRGQPNPYHCAASRYRRDACEAAKQLAGKPLLSKEAPPLPLPECTALNCGCRYAHHEDRRVHDRGNGLRSPFAMGGGTAGPEGVSDGRTSFCHEFKKRYSVAVPSTGTRQPTISLGFS